MGNTFPVLEAAFVNPTDLSIPGPGIGETEPFFYQRIRDLTFFYATKEQTTVQCL